MIAEPLEIEQWESIKTQLDDDFGPGVTNHIKGNLMPVVMREDRKESIYLVPTDWRSYTEKEITDFEPSSLGLFFGKMVDGEFRPSLSIIDRLHDVSENRIKVSQQGAEAFTYGRSILRESVVDLPQGLQRGQRVVVLNEADECIGLAKLSIESSKVDRLAKDRLVAKNLIDIGWYIRRYG